jgi:hypothetical protein
MKMVRPREAAADSESVTWITKPYSPRSVGVGSARDAAREGRRDDHERRVSVVARSRVRSPVRVRRIGDDVGIARCIGIITKDIGIMSGIIPVAAVAVASDR